MDQLLGGLTARQLAEWQAYDRLVAEEQRRASLAAKAEAGLGERRARRKARP